MKPTLVIFLLSFIFPLLYLRLLHYSKKVGERVKKNNEIFSLILYCITLPFMIK